MRLLILSFLLISTQLHGQDSSATTLPFSKGVNLTNWFQANSPGSIDFSKYTYEDFSDIKTHSGVVVGQDAAISNLRLQTN